MNDGTAYTMRKWNVKNEEKAKIERHIGIIVCAILFRSVLFCFVFVYKWCFKNRHHIVSLYMFASLTW